MAKEVKTEEVKPKAVEVKTEAFDVQKAYGEYVKGRPINAIAGDLKVEPQEVVEAIAKVEAKRGK